MNRTMKIVCTIVLCGLLAGCNIPAAAPLADPTATQQPTATIAPTETQAATETAVPRLDEHALRNGTFDLPVYEQRVTLADGNYSAGEGSERLMVVMLPQIAWGDLNGDGLEDAAVVIGENGGGSGTFVSVIALLNQNGQAVQSGAVLVDDRPRVDGLKIEAGEIVLEGVIHGPDDPMAAPTLTVIEKYRLSETGLRLVNFASQPAGGGWHSIAIESPRPGETASGEARLVGSMPVGPFENNLRLRILSEDDTVVYEGPFGVQSADIGAPATFDQAVDLSAAAAGARVWVELAELSMKDGSTLALATVDVLRGGE